MQNRSQDTRNCKQDHHDIFCYKSLEHRGYIFVKDSSSREKQSEDLAGQRLHNIYDLKRDSEDKKPSVTHHETVKLYPYRSSFLPQKSLLLKCLVSSPAFNVTASHICIICAYFSGEWKHNSANRRHGEQCWLRRVRADQSEATGLF